MLVGGAGRRVHRIAAQHADAVGFTGLGRVHDDGQRAEPARFSVRCVDEDIDAVRAAAGVRLPQLELQALVQAVVVTDDPAGTAETIRQRSLPSLAADDVLSTPYLLIGTVEDLIEKLLEQRERWGFSHYTVRPEALGQLEPVIDELTGR